MIKKRQQNIWFDWNRFALCADLKILSSIQFSAMRLFCPMRRNSVQHCLGFLFCSFRRASLLCHLPFTLRSFLEHAFAIFHRFLQSDGGLIFNILTLTFFFVVVLINIFSFLIVFSFYTRSPFPSATCPHFMGHVSNGCTIPFGIQSPPFPKMYFFSSRPAHHFKCKQFCWRGQRPT